MDCLDNMLTDPLELGSAPEVNGAGIMEECLLGGTRVSLPEDLLEDPDIFFDVVSRSTWDEVLSQSQRDHLRKFLPQFTENNLERQDNIITGLFDGDNVRFGNPLYIAQKLFRDGYFNPEVVKYRRLCMKSQYKRYLYSQQQYFHKLLKQILISRKELLELARKSGPDMTLKRKYQAISSQKEEERRVHSRYEKILREVKEECEDNSISSDEEELCSWLPNSPTHPTSPSVALRAVPTLCTQDMKTVNKPELGDEELKIMLRKHVEKRRQQPDHPDLATGDLTLNDIITRMNAGRRGSLAALLDLTFPKKRVKDKEERKKKKLKVIKTEPEDLAESSGAEGATAAAPEQQIVTRPVTAPEQTLDATKLTAIPGITASFFGLLQEILLAEGEASVAGIEEKVLEWQISAPSTLNSWFSDASNWSELVHSALRFLSGEGGSGMSTLPSNFAPYVNCTERGQQWKWIGSGRDSEKEVTSLCQLWFEVKDQTFPKESEELPDIAPPTPRVRTDYVVRPSTGDEKRVFQEQERQRYSQPHKAFTFRMHGFDSVVGPVKGVFDKDPSLNKAREHSLLRSDRPAYVTILSLVRDAAARLPNGEGTRAEICELLKDSQFLAPEVTSAQINTVVSGALDRLHYEKDPCVKYDIGRKLWIYLHRNRSEEEFERIHQAQAAAAKAKKALQQKPKLTTKIKSSGKESATKLPLSEQSLGSQVLADSSLPVTPVTPVTPTLPVTPTSSPVSTDGNKVQTTSAPELVKSGQSVLLVSSPTMPQLGNLLSGTQPGQYTGSQTQARVLSQSVAAPLPQVRVVSAQQGLASSSHQASVVQQVQQHQHQIRLPTVTAAAHTKVLPQSILTVPVKAQSGVSTVHIQQSSAKANLTMAGISAASKTVSSTLNGTTSSSASTIIQSVAGQSIMRQVAIAGQLGMKTQSSTGIPLTATNIQIQGKDVLRLAPSSITTDSKGQTVLRITQDMMATLTKAPVTTVKLTPDMLGGKGISATLHVTPAMPPTDSMVKASTSTTSSTTSTVVKVTPDLKVTEASSTAIRLMPALAVTVADQKGKASASLSSTDTKPAATIRIMPGLGVIPKSGQAIAVATSSKLFTAAGTMTSAAVTLATAGSKAITKVTPTAGLPISIGTGTTTVRQVPVSATMVSTTQATKLPATITVPLSVLNQPLKGKGVMAGQIIKGNLGANISGLGRNIILTTMPAGTKLITGNKPVSFVTAQQLQQLQQQGQATQVRIQHLPAQQLHQGTVISSTKPISTVVVTTAPSVNQQQDQ
ncbi:nuclear factor related to kappa-B-binding protein isoform X1 [Carcharodon carcharias]|uniref:nuclear factor related to kappa-B-binding protein isoform X1 n=1 Tax=Carcharodon carcharias TaxID=13397 RepID=UPI001B7DDF08|nr:nuclear factor related to kappa-B-binding protein isoform X1 [Carcharodon carcharias]